MKLNRLIIQGFKSFKDKTVILFDQGITGIVGPNGCGKSNIVDALFWVMGEQSAKHLRGSSMKDLIFAGSSKYSPASFAEVTLVLENIHGKHVNINGALSKPAEIHLTRKLYRNGETEYRINNEPARLKDIHEVFMDTGAGAKSYSIIAQGEINKLVQAKPEERRVMIEEVAGITKFKLRKKESLKKIDQTQANLIRLEDLQNEIYKNLKNLEKQAEKAEKARSLKEKVKKYELIVQAHKEHDYLQDFVHAHSTLDQRAEEFDELSVKKSQLEILLEDEKIQKTDLMEKIDLSQEDYNEHSKKLAACEERIKHLNKSLTEKEQFIERTSLENEELREDINKREERLQALTEEIQELENGRYEEKDFSELEEKVELLKSQLKDGEEEILEKRNILSQTKDKFQKLENEYSRNAERIEDYSRNLQDLTTEIEELEKNSSNFTDDLVKERALVQSSAEDVQSLEKDVATIKSDIDSLQIEMKKTDGEFRELSREVIQLESRKNSLIEINNSVEGTKKGALELLKKADDKTLGLLGQLIECDKEFAIPFEKLVGELFDSVLPASLEMDFSDLISGVEGSLDIIKPLKDSVSQDSIDKLKNQGCQGIVALSDIIKVTQQEHKDFLMRIFSGFFIVENLTKDLISKIDPEIQFKGLISKDGTLLIKKFGHAIIYGTRKIEDGDKADGIIQRNNLIKELSDALEEKQIKLAIVETTLKQLENELEEKKVLLEEKSCQLNEVRTLWVKTKASLEAKEFHQSSSSSKLEILQKRKSEFSHSRLELLESNEKNIDEKQILEEQIENTEEELVDLESRCEELKANFETERDEMMSLKVKAQSYQQQLKSLNAQLEDVNSQIERYQKKLETNIELRETYQNTIDDSLQEIEEVETSNKDMAESLAEKESYLSLLKDQISQILLSMQEKENELKEINNRLNKIEKENVELELKVSQIIIDEELLVKDVFEVYKVNLRETLKEYHQFTSEQLEDLKDISSIFIMESEDGPKEIMAKPYDFEKRFPGQVKEAQQKFKNYRSDFQKLGEINWQAIEDYERQKLRHDFLKTQEEELKKSLNDLQTAISHIDEKSKVRFKEAFAEVDERFSKVFPIIFGGGEAKLEVKGDLDSIDCGVDIIAKPPGKKMQSITLMSGGEKAMTAVSLIFSIFLVKPSPFCLLDEVDAPLDDANVGRFNELLREMSSESQFILITHNKKTMELNDVLYGVTMQEPGVSKAVSVQLH